MINKVENPFFNENPISVEAKKAPIEGGSFEDSSKEQTSEIDARSIIEQIDSLERVDDYNVSNVDFAVAGLRKVLEGLFLQRKLNPDLVRIESKEEKLHDFHGDEEIEGGIFLNETRVASFTIPVMISPVKPRGDGSVVNWDLSKLDETLKDILKES